MAALLWAIVGIGLVGALLVGGVSLFQATGSERLRVKEAMVAEVNAESAAHQAFLNANGFAATNYATQIVGYYIMERKLPVSGMTWSNGNDATYGYYICLSGSVPSSASCNGLADASSSFATSSYYINSTSCVTRSNVACSSIGTWPSTMYITYWLRGS